MDGGAAEPKVAVLLCTYQGERYLAEQLDSMAAQRHRNWDLHVSDDGSTDATMAIVAAYQRKWGADRTIRIQQGPGKGFAANFLSLACRSDFTADFYAFSDQDDIWEADKLTRAVGLLRTVPDDTPAFYCGRTRLVDAENREIGMSPGLRRPPTFGNALAQSVGGGNTIVFNNATRALLQEAGADVPIITHDWWIYMLVTGCGGVVMHDDHPTLRYRQHDSNVIGMNTTLGARLKRIGMLWAGRYRAWNDGNIAALRRVEARLTPANRAMLQDFAAARDMPLVPRLRQLRRIGIRRQTLFGNLGLTAAAVFRRM